MYIDCEKFKGAGGAKSTRARRNPRVRENRRTCGTWRDYSKPPRYSELAVYRNCTAHLLFDVFFFSIQELHRPCHLPTPSHRLETQHQER